MNNNVKKIVLGASAVAMLGMAVVGGGAFAKYITSVTGTGTGQVAKWDVNLSPITIANKTYTPATLNADRIAPGTEGEFDIDLDIGETETGVKYSLEITDEQNIPQNMYFMVGDTKCSTISEAVTAASGTINANATGDDRKVNQKVKWKWDYETGNDTASKNANNLKDKADGEAAKNMSFTVSVIAEQTEPVAQ